MTEYVVLKQVTNNETTAEETYTVFSRAESQTAKGAIRKAVESEPGIYVAIPTRSFQPISVDVETKTSVKVAALA